MTDRELLELAAKAAGIEIKPIDELPHQDWCTYWSSDICTCGAIWNPLTDDGDALRLAVKLGIVCSASLHPKYVHDSDTMQAWALPDDMRTDIYAGEEWSKQSGDPYAATRRAIVRAAAEIGKRAEVSEKR